MSEIVLLIMITDRASVKDYSDIESECPIPLALGALGRGTATTETLDYLGIESTEKAIMFAVTTSLKAHDTIKHIKKKIYLDIPGGGIIITVPVQSIADGIFFRHMIEHQETKGRENTMTLDSKHELIIAITGEGNTDVVMDAARGSGATGGTVIHAKGVSDDIERKFFGLSIASEKEMIFIVVKAKDKAAIMRAIVHAVDGSADIKTMVLSLPVTTVEGMYSTDDIEDED